ncbi:lytic transglycosylase domain-containing protein [Nocardioides sp. SYSU D00065]|uniref:lytic transglycosylase domain-containing protein n=1 Tax=Nocardioides sp. SYSU D00065 TaxID=2817378 RepID=UPI001B33963B|nr:lytic murein transglycosylase [Nocardioides sp. SYSU D00065]
MSGPTSRRWLVPALAIVLLVLGTIAVTLAVALAVTRDEPAPASSTADPRSSEQQVPVVPRDDHVGAATSTASGVAELADPAWVSASAAALDIPPRALAAYAGASVAVTDTHPGCGLGWNTLAAIGEVESEHGTIGRSVLDDDGDTDPPILGVPLDGDGVAEIPDTDDGSLDQDAEWDRAVGPMQFIPSTWEEHATDGNGDGVPDVHNLDDAALTAAAYLCSTGTDLTQPDDWTAAITSYNPDAGYHNRVAEAATRYAEAVAGGGN